MAETKPENANFDEIYTFEHATEPKIVIAFNKSTNEYDGISPAVMKYLEEIYPGSSLEELLEDKTIFELISTQRVEKRAENVPKKPSEKVLFQHATEDWTVWIVLPDYLICPDQHLPDEAIDFFQNVKDFPLKSLIDSLILFKVEQPKIGEPKGIPQVPKIPKELRVYQCKNTKEILVLNQNLNVVEKSSTLKDKNFTKDFILKDILGGRNWTFIGTKRQDLLSEEYANSLEENLQPKISGRNAKSNEKFVFKHSLPQNCKEILSDWLTENRDNPYPSENEKRALIFKTGLTGMQIANWFINARRRYTDQYSLLIRRGNKDEFSKINENFKNYEKFKNSERSRNITDIRNSKRAKHPSNDENLLKLTANINDEFIKCAEKSPNIAENADSAENADYTENADYAEITDSTETARTILSSILQCAPALPEVANTVDVSSCAEIPKNHAEISNFAEISNSTKIPNSAEILESSNDAKTILASLLTGTPLPHQAENSISTENSSFGRIGQLSNCQEKNDVPTNITENALLINGPNQMMLSQV